MRRKFINSLYGKRLMRKKEEEKLAENNGGGTLSKYVAVAIHPLISISPSAPIARQDFPPLQHSGEVAKAATRVHVICVPRPTRQLPNCPCSTAIPSGA